MLSIDHKKPPDPFSNAMKNEARYQQGGMSQCKGGCTTIHTLTPLLSNRYSCTFDNRKHLKSKTS